MRVFWHSESLGKRPRLAVAVAGGSRPVGDVGVKCPVQGARLVDVVFAPVARIHSSSHPQLHQPLAAMRSRHWRSRCSTSGGAGLLTRPPRSPGVAVHRQLQLCPADRTSRLHSDRLSGSCEITDAPLLDVPSAFRARPAWAFRISRQLRSRSGGSTHRRSRRPRSQASRQPWPWLAAPSAFLVSRPAPLAGCILRFLRGSGLGSGLLMQACLRCRVAAVSASISSLRA